MKHNQNELMKLFYRTFIILVLLVGISSCDNEPIGEHFDGEMPTDAQFKVDIDGETFYADNSGALTEDGHTQITGKRNDGHRVNLSFDGSGTGDFILDGTPEGTGFYYDNQDVPYSMDGVDTIGIVTITKYDVNNQLASGTFSFKAARSGVFTDTTSTDSTATPTPTNDTIELTNGEFTDIHLESDLAPPPEEDYGNFHVLLDDELYTGNEIQAANTTNEGLVISTSNGSAQFILQVFNPEVGTFDIGEDSTSDGLIIYNPDSTDEAGHLFGADQGTVSISEIDENNQVVSGTFSGTLADVDNPDSTITMTEGVFENIPYTTEVAADQFINAKIGNDDFNSSDIITEDASGNIVHVIGTDQLDNQLQLNFPTNVNTGSYSVTANDAFSAVYSETDQDTGDVVQYHSFNDSGSFEIESVNGNTVSGTFSFSVSNDNGEVIQVTAGQFKFDL